MIYKRIFLDGDNRDVYLDVYAADKTDNFVRKAMLVLPGGGYGACSEREGEPVAMAFMPYGYNAFVLNYSVSGKKTYPGQLIEASLAMKHIKNHAEEYNIDPEKVFVTGFSAGGHLAASLGVQWHKKEIYDAIDMEYGYNKPAGMILIYPVISGDPEIAHKNSFIRLTGCDEPSDDILNMCSMEKHVDEKTSPAFIMHTSNDQLVNVNNSLRFAEALSLAGHTFEMHIYPDAPHGIALGNKITSGTNPKFDNPSIASWIEQAAKWADSIS